MSEGSTGPRTTNATDDTAGLEPAVLDSAVLDSAVLDSAADPTDPADSADLLAERVVDTRVIHRGRYLEMRVLTIERGDGSRSTRDIVWHPGAVGIVALDPDDNVLLVRQFRVAAGRTLLEIPAGTLDVDAATGAVEEPAVAAARELEEETGYRAGHWQPLGDFWTAPGFATERMWLFLATDLRLADADRLGPDEDEHLQLERLPWHEAVDAADRGEIHDAKSLVGLLRLARLRGTDLQPGAPSPPGSRAAAQAG